MPKKKNNLKTLIIILAAVIIVAVGFKFLGKGSANTATPQTGLVTSSSTGAPVTPGVIAANGISAGTEQSNELVILLKSVSTLTLPDAVFTNPVFNVLQDISSRIRIEGDPGRSNPFLPIGQDQNVISLGVNPADFDASQNGAITNTDALQTFLNGGGM